jgi:hypothetical protein
MQHGYRHEDLRSPIRKLALAANFTDRILPKGRPQGNSDDLRTKNYERPREYCRIKAISSLIASPINSIMIELAAST